MLIEINLLPKKQPKNFAIFISTFIFLIILCGSLGFMYYYSTTINTQINTIKQSAHTVQVERLELEKEISDRMTATELNQSDVILKDIVDKTVMTSVLIEQMDAQLPDGAEIPTYNYADAAAMNITVKVNVANEVGQFAEGLEALTWVDRAKVQTITANTGEEEGFTGTLALTLQADGDLIKESGETE